jgi:DNA-binding NarL/FixJ family response regulator
VPDAAARLAALTYLEEDVLGGLMRRLTTKEIAGELGIAPATVKRHVSTIYDKLGVHSRRAAERLVAAAGWAARPPPTTARPT